MKFAPGFSIAVSGIYSHTTRLPVAIDTNLLVPPDAHRLYAGQRQNVSYKNWNAGLPDRSSSSLDAADPLGAGRVYPCALTLNARPAVSPCFVNPLITQNNQYTSAASALYEGFIFEAKKRFSNHFTLFGNYTFSKGFDTSTDFNTDYGPQDPTNLGAGSGPFGV